MVSDTHLSAKMLRYLRIRCDSTTSPTRTIFFFQNYPFFLSSSLRSISSCVIDNGNSYMVSYLIENCGLSQKLALSASKNINFKTPRKPDSVLAFFKTHGFSNTQITTVIRKRPSVLLADPEKTLSPKVNFFYSKGFSRPDIAKVLSVCPDILHSSMENQIIPAFNVIRNLVHSDKKAICAIKRFPRIMLSYLDIYVLPNIKILQESGLPESSIAWLVRSHPITLITSSDRLTEMVEEAKRMGLNALSLNFVVAIHVFRSMSKTNWEKKIDIFKKWGWSEEEIIVAFGKHPWCLMCSEKKITAMMDFYINKMGWDSSSIAYCPILISLSLEKRVLPRCSVLKVLLSKSMIRLTRIYSPLLISEELFLHKFVIPYEKKSPNLLTLYQKKLNLAKCEKMEKES